MINYAGMKSEENSGSDFGQLPVGAYLGYVIDAKVEGLKPDQSLVLAIDVAEGEYKDFFMNKLAAQKKAGSQYEVKYKGTYRLRIPNPDNKKAMYPQTDLKRMNDMIFRFEKSNPGFHWDGDEQKLKGLQVGFSMQEDEYNGNTFTRIGRLDTYQDVQAGLVKAMKPRKRSGDANDSAFLPPMPAADPQTGFTPVELDSLPF